MRQKWEYFLRLFCPGKLYDYSTKIRIPQDPIDFRKFLVAKWVLDRGGSAIDGGAHIGYYTRYFSEIVKNKGKVYSFEPNPYMFQLLNKYAKFHANVICFQKALSHIPSEASFYVEPFSLSQDSGLNQARPQQRKIKIETVALDSYIDEKENIRLIKLDIEGYEKQAILGARNLIHRCRPWLVVEYVQNQDRDDREVLFLLREWGYVCLNCTTLKQVNPQEKVDLIDILAIPEEEEKNKILQVLESF